MGIVQLCAWLVVAGTLLAQTRPANVAPKPTELERAVAIFKEESRNRGLREDSNAAEIRTNGAGKKKNRWHGRLFENFRNDFLDAVPHDVVQRGGRQNILRRNQFGMNLTGPIVIPKLYDGDRVTFFTVTIEGVREKVGRSALRTIPTLAERTGDWSGTVDAAGAPLAIYDPQSTSANPQFDRAQPVSTQNLEYLRTPFPGNRIPTARLDATAQQALRLYPNPNSDAGPFFRNNYFVFTPEENRSTGSIIRVDHSFKDKNRVTLSVNNSKGTDGAAPLFANAANPGTVTVDRSNRRVGIEHVLTPSARSTNTLTLAAASTEFAYRGFRNSDGQPFPFYRFQPYLSMGQSYPASKSARNLFVVTDGFSQRRGKHRLAVSGNLVQEQVHIFAPQYPSGFLQFSAGLTSLPGIVNTGHAFASFLLGGADYAEKSLVISPSYFRKTRTQIAFSDQWELRKGLQLAIALTVDGTGPRTEKYNRQSTISPYVLNPANGRRGALIAAAINGAGRGFQPFVFKAQPSASLTWNVDAHSVARATYARAYTGIPIYTSQWGTQAFNGAPTWISTNPQLQSAVTLSRGLTDASRVFPDLRPDSANNTVADMVELTGRQPTYQSAALSYERQMPAQVLVTAGAAHSQGRNLLLSNLGSNPNAIPLAALSYRDQLNAESFKRELRPYPQYQRFDVFSSWPEGRYKRDAAYLRLEKRSSSGLSMSVYYEFSKQMDDYSGPYGVQDYYNRDNEWSLTSSNNPHRLSLTYVYELPFGPNRGLLTASDWRRYIFEGWSLSGSTTMTSGEPIALRPQFNNTGGVVDALHVNSVAGVDPNVANQGPERWFNPEAFAQPADFTVGDLSRTHPTLRMPGNQNHDLSLSKRFAITVERSLELSMVGLNFVNHANWTDPDTFIGPASAPNVNAGRIIGSRGGRVIQLGLRYSF